MPPTLVTIWPDVPIGRVNPNLFGQFAEHLGSCIYEGVWVGEKSKMPNTRGIRNDVVKAMRKLRVPVIRWPGGCFADYYHWEDGIGARDRRPRRINLHWGEVIETNEFGTHEFIDWCRQVGSEPYICGNVGSGSPTELASWLEYCNFAGDSTWSRLRARNGHPDPMNVRYWGVGNESWGCGGRMDPEDYAAEYRRFATFLHGFGQPIELIACGQRWHDLAWARRFFEKFQMKGPLDGWAFHFYTTFRWNGEAGTDVEYTEEQWNRLLTRAMFTERILLDTRAILDSYDPHRKIDLILDEWGTWHPPVPGRNPAFLWQQNTMRDALAAALSLDIFVKHADKLAMANIAQTINVLQAIILTEGDRMALTPTYHVFDMYSAHMGAASVRCAIDAKPIWREEGAMACELPALAGSASIQDKTLHLTLANPSSNEAREARIALRDGARASTASARILANRDVHAHNTFDHPNRVRPVKANAVIGRGALTLEMPPASVAAVRIDLV